MKLNQIVSSESEQKNEITFAKNRPQKAIRITK